MSAPSSVAGGVVRLKELQIHMLLCSADRASTARATWAQSPSDQMRLASGHDGAELRRPALGPGRDQPPAHGDQPGAAPRPAGLSITFTASPSQRRSACTWCVGAAFPHCAKRVLSSPSGLRMRTPLLTSSEALDGCFFGGDVAAAHGESVAQGLSKGNRLKIVGGSRSQPYGPINIFTGHHSPRTKRQPLHFGTHALRHPSRSAQRMSLAAKRCQG